MSFSSLSSFFSTLLFAFSVLLLSGSGATEVHKVTFNTPRPANIECFQRMNMAMPMLYRQVTSSQLFLGRINVRHAIPAHNDMMCTDPEWMMNAVVTVEDTITNEAWYGIFHIHVSPDGTLKSPLAHETSPWIKYTQPAEWQMKWCDFIDGLYPDDHKAQCTPNNN